MMDHKKLRNSWKYLLIYGTLVNLKWPQCVPIRLINILKNCTRRVWRTWMGAIGRSLNSCWWNIRIDLFYLGKGDLGWAGMAKHRVDVGKSSPIWKSIKVVPLANKEEAKRVWGDKHTGNHWVFFLSRPWLCCVVWARRKNGSAWFCVKYRKFELSDKEALIFFVSNLPIPHSGLQAQSCPWLVDDDRETTAFTTREGLKGCGSFYRVFADWISREMQVTSTQFLLNSGRRMA